MMPGCLALERAVARVTAVNDLLTFSAPRRRASQGNGVADA